MSFESNGDTMATTQLSECKPNYEQQAAQMKMEIDASVNLKEALLKFREINGAYGFRKISSFAEMVGGVELVKLQAEASYADILKRIEES